jgi:hypothetical protein
MNILIEQSKDPKKVESPEEKKKRRKRQKQKIEAEARAKKQGGDSTDNTTIPSPQTSDNTDKVTQTSNVELPPSENDKYKIWIQHSRSGREFNRPEFVMAIQTAYLNKDKKQDVY